MKEDILKKWRIVDSSPKKKATGSTLDNVVPDYILFMSKLREEYSKFIEDNMIYKTTESDIYEYSAWLEKKLYEQSKVINT